MMPHATICRLLDITLASVSDMNGRSVRTVGKILTFDPGDSLAVLIEPKQSAIKSAPPLKVSTKLLDDENFCPGSTVMVIGELEEVIGDAETVVDSETCIDPKLLSSIDPEKNKSKQIEVILKARASTCADRLDYELFLRSLEILKNLTLEPNDIAIS